MIPDLPDSCVSLQPTAIAALLPSPSPPRARSLPPRPHLLHVRHRFALGLICYLLGMDERSGRSRRGALKKEAGLKSDWSS